MLVRSIEHALWAAHALLLQSPTLLTILPIYVFSTVPPITLQILPREGAWFTAQILILVMTQVELVCASKHVLKTTIGTV